MWSNSNGLVVGGGVHLQAREDLFGHLESECVAAFVHHIPQQLQERVVACGGREGGGKNLLSDEKRDRGCDGQPAQASTCSAMLDTIALASFTRALTCMTQI